MTTEGSEDVYQVNFNRRKKQKNKSFYNARRSVAIKQGPGESFDSVEWNQNIYVPAQTLDTSEMRK